MSADGTLGVVMNIPQLTELVSQTNEIKTMVGQCLTQLQDLQRKVGIIMSEDATLAAEAGQIETEVTAENTALASLQASWATLQAEVASEAGAPTAATMAAMAQAVADLSTAGTAETTTAAAEASQVAPTPPPAT